MPVCYIGNIFIDIPAVEWKGMRLSAPQQGGHRIPIYLSLPLLKGGGFCAAPLIEASPEEEIRCANSSSFLASLVQREVARRSRDGGIV